MNRCLKFVFFVLLASQPLGAQTFQNLDFEAATVAATGVQPYGSFVPIASASPGWTAYLGSVQITQVGYNSPTIGTATITVIGPTWNSTDVEDSLGAGIIDGNYSIYLEAGANPLAPTPDTVNAAIQQAGTIPAGTQTLLFDATQTAGLTVTFNGNVLNPIALSSGMSADGLNYELFGANISVWTGQTGILNFTDADFGVLDDIQFSQTTIAPESSPLLLTGIGGMIFASWRRFRRQ